MSLEINNAKCLEGIKMFVSFNNGESRLFDIATIVDKTFSCLHDALTCYLLIWVAIHYYLTMNRSLVP